MRLEDEQEMWCGMRRNFVGWVEGVRRGSRDGSRRKVQGVCTPPEMTRILQKKKKKKKN